MGSFSGVNSRAFIQARHKPPEPGLGNNRDGNANALVNRMESGRDLIRESLAVNMELTEGARSALEFAKQAERISRRQQPQSLFGRIRQEFAKTLQLKMQQAGKPYRNLEAGLERLSETVSRATSQRVEENRNRFSMESLSVSVSVQQVDIAVTHNNRTTRLQMQRIEIRIDYFALEVSEEPVLKDPLVFDIDGDGIETERLDQGVYFDMDADGAAERTAWIGEDDAFLAYDRNGDGRINNGRELFGDQNGARDGIAELARFDDNKDGIIDKADDIFEELLLKFGDGRLEKLSDHGILRLDLNSVVYDERRIAGGVEAARFKFDKDDGSRGEAAEILLETLA